MSTSKTGKHGHAKCAFVAVDIFTGKKMEDLSPSSHNVDVPHVSRTDYTLLDIGDDGFVSGCGGRGAAGRGVDENSTSFLPDLRPALRLPSSLPVVLRSLHAYRCVSSPLIIPAMAKRTPATSWLPGWPALVHLQAHHLSPPPPHLATAAFRSPS